MLKFQIHNPGSYNMNRNNNNRNNKRYYMQEEGMQMVERCEGWLYLVWPSGGIVGTRAWANRSPGQPGAAGT